MPDILTRANQKHVLITPATCRCNKLSDYPCPICDGGLAVCSLCGAAEIEMEGPCLPQKVSEAVSKGENQSSANSEAVVATPETIHISLLGDEAKLKRLAEIKERHRAWSVTDLPRHEYAASYHDEELLLELIATTISLPALRAVILTLLDDGCTCDSGEKHPWELDDGPDEIESEIVTQQRVRFVDSLERRLRQLPARG